MSAAARPGIRGLLQRPWWMFLALANMTCSRSEPEIACVDGLNTPENVSSCWRKRYLANEKDKKDSARRRKFADALRESGEARFREGRYSKAYVDFSTSLAWEPTYNAMVRTGDAIFYMHAFAEEVDGGEPSPAGCSGYFVKEVELHLPQTYDAALMFFEFEEKQTGHRPPNEEVEEVRRKSACLKGLREKALAEAQGCVPRPAILQCLKGTGG